MFNTTFQSERTIEDAEVNLTPMMNLFVVMIPFLLMSAAFFQLSVINAAVPTISEEVVAPHQSEQVMNVIVQIETDGFHISGSGEEVSLEQLDSVRARIPLINATLNLEQLSVHLSRIKNKFPRGNTAILMPHADTSYEDIVATMDAARWGMQLQKSTERKLLYPNVVLSSREEEK